MTWLKAAGWAVLLAVAVVGYSRSEQASIQHKGFAHAPVHLFNR